MEKVLMKGNEALAEGALAAGCRYFFGYPITPQNELPAYLAKRLPRRAGAFLQAESEIGAINMVLGAASTGQRVLTSSSGPGISLKQEGISYIAGSEVPLRHRQHHAGRIRASAECSLPRQTTSRPQGAAATATTGSWFLLLPLCRNCMI